MALKTKVKVGQVTNLSEARYCAGMGVDLIGFPIGLQPGQLSLDEVKEISGWIAGPQLVFETNPCLDAPTLRQVTLLSPDCLIEVPLEQLTTHCIQTVKDHPLIVSTGYDDWREAAKKREELNIQYIIIKTHHWNVAWDEIGQLNASIPVLLQHQETLRIDDLLHRPISGLALTGTAESRPGLKEYSHLADVLEALESD